MSNIIVRPIAELRVIAKAAFTSGFYGFKNEEQAFTALIASQDMGMNATRFMQDYHIISNRPAKKTETAYRDFKKAGGRCEWIETNDKIAKAKLTAPDGDSITLEYTFEQATKAGLTSNANYTKNPADMLRSRVLSKGIKAIYPQAYDGFLSTDEAIELKEEQPQQEEIIEAETTINTDDLKRSLSNKLKKDFSFTSAMIKEFAEINNLAENEELLSELVSNKDKLNTYVEAFEKGL